MQTNPLPIPNLNRAKHISFLQKYKGVDGILDDILISHILLFGEKEAYVSSCLSVIAIQVSFSTRRNLPNKKR
jgi:hypothetical protein